MTSPVFMTPEQARIAQEAFGSPIYIYDAATLAQRAKEMLAFPNAYGLTVRYAMKALPNAAVLRLFADMGLKIDASSGFEAERAIYAGIDPENIQITAQEIPRNLEELIRKGVLYNACSLHQLDNYGKCFPGTDCCVRINPGLGSGHSNRTNVGGPSSSFGIWHEHLNEVVALAEKHNLTITGMHTHIGSGSDPDTWVHCARMSLEIAAKMPDVTRLSLGGGYKVARMPDEISADIQVIGRQIVPEFQDFAEEYGRELHLEVEPGTYLVANAGAVLCSIVDIVDTGAEGHTFLKTDSGMTDVLRPSMYGAQHPMCLIPQEEEVRGTKEYLIAGHCCESGDVLTPAPGDPEGLLPRELTEAKIGDLLVVDGSGAYCASMSSKNYNSFPESAEVMLEFDGSFRLIRKRQTLEQIFQNEE